MASRARPRARPFPRRFGCRRIPAWKSRRVDCGVTGRLRLRALGASAAQMPATATMARPRSRSRAQAGKVGERPTSEGGRPPGHWAAKRPGRVAGCAVTAGGTRLAVALSAHKPMGPVPGSCPETLPAGPEKRCQSPLLAAADGAPHDSPRGRDRTGGTPASDLPAKRAKRLALKRPRKRRFTQTRFLTPARLTPGQPG
jgi:hypothetical protein